MNSNGRYHAYRSLQSSQNAVFRCEFGAERGCCLSNAFATATKIGLERFRSALVIRDLTPTCEIGRVESNTANRCLRSLLKSPR